ncbi:LysR family transcriptional regulator [Consotaella aegiceratis]|uniref:LysR family transcriptional regulator n=1 Tax=Consotaella aegiceratis TaxID=3097961 RepID=UPI002F402BE5
MSQKEKYQSVDFIHLRYFSAAAERGSFRQAAAALGVQQSSISRAIQRLEGDLGVSLFERGKLGIRLTNAGRRLLDDARVAVDQLERAKREAAAAGRGDLGNLKIGVITSLASGFLRDLLETYARQQPQISIEIWDGSRKDHISAVRSRGLDVAFLTGVSVVQGCDTAELWRERIHLAVPRNHRLASRRRLDWSDLRGERFIVSRFPPGPEVLDYIVRRTGNYGTCPDIEFQAVQLGTLLNLVGMERGITVVSESLAAVRLPNVVLRPLMDPEDEMPISAVWSPDNDNPALRRFNSVAHVLAGRVRPGSSDWTHRVA